MQAFRIISIKSFLSFFLLFVLGGIFFVIDPLDFLPKSFTTNTQEKLVPTPTTINCADAKYVPHYIFENGQLKQINSLPCPSPTQRNDNDETMLAETLVDQIGNIHVANQLNTFFKPEDQIVSFVPKGELTIQEPFYSFFALIVTTQASEQEYYLTLKKEDQTFRVVSVEKL